MSSTNYDYVNFQGFVDQYMDAGGTAFPHQEGTIKIYPLSLASTLINPPTHLFRANYNFLLLFLSGGGVQQVDNANFELKPNDILFIREGHLNAIKSIHANTTGFFIYIDSTLLPQIFSDSSLLHRLTFYPNQSISRQDMEWICSCCELIADHKIQNGYSRQIQTFLLKAIVLKLAEASAAARSKPDRQSEITMLFKELLYEKFVDNREVKFYADSLAVSENYLNRCVSYTTQKPPKQHINEMLIIHSKILLLDRSKNITQVALKLNFSDSSYFGRLFKKVTGQTPKEYRDLLMQGLSE